MKLKDNDIGFLKLLLRSEDTGEGWRKVSTILWKLVSEFPHQELIETRNGNEVRLSDKGLILVNYI